MKTRRPDAIEPTATPFTITEASVTRWTTARIISPQRQDGSRCALRLPDLAAPWLAKHCHFNRTGCGKRLAVLFYALDLMQSVCGKVIDPTIRADYHRYVLDYQ